MVIPNQYQPPLFQPSSIQARKLSSTPTSNQEAKMKRQEAKMNNIADKKKSTSLPPSMIIAMGHAPPSTITDMGQAPPPSKMIENRYGLEFLQGFSKNGDKKLTRKRKFRKRKCRVFSLNFFGSQRVMFESFYMPTMFGC